MEIGLDWDFSCRLETTGAVRTNTPARGTSLWTEPGLKLCKAWF